MNIHFFCTNLNSEHQLRIFVSSFKDVIKEFPASWFAMIMGTAAFGTATYLMADKYSLSWLRCLSYGVVFYNFMAFLVLLIPFTLKLILFTDVVKSEFRDPFKSTFYVTFGVGMLALSTNFSIVLPNFPAYFVFWYAGSLATIIIETALLFATFINTHVELKHITPSWFLGTTGLLLIPGAGSSVLRVELVRNLSQFLIDFSFGAGFFLFIAFFAIWIYRFILHEPLERDRMPLFWINLGPVGAGLTSLVTYYIFLPGLRGVATFFALLFFGTGVWWFFMSLIVTFYYIRRVPIPYRTAWWSFTFPTGQFFVGSYYFNEYIKCRSINEFLIFVYAVLAVIWFLNIALMFKSILRGNLREVETLE